MTNEDYFAATAIKAWTVTTTRIEKILSSLSEDELQVEVAPGRNRVYYIVGHLTAIHDRLFPMLGLGDRMYPDLDEFFLNNPDRMLPDNYTGGDLRRMLSEVNEKITALVQAMPPTDLLLKHADVSAEDFAKDPLRNRIGVIENRTAHAMYHAGQIRLATKR